MSGRRRGRRGGGRRELWTGVSLNPVSRGSVVVTEDQERKRSVFAGWLRRLIVRRRRIQLAESLIGVAYRRAARSDFLLGASRCNPRANGDAIETRSNDSMTSVHQCRSMRRMRSYPPSWRIVLTVKPRRGAVLSRSDPTHANQAIHRIPGILSKIQKLSVSQWFAHDARRSTAMVFIEKIHSLLTPRSTGSEA